MLVGVVLAQERLARDDPVEDVGRAVLLLELVLVLQEMESDRQSACC